MGLALLLVILKTLALRTGDEHYNRAARFWAKIFGINFALGVVTGIPMEFQFGTNWAEFSKAAGGVIGQTLAMEGVFSFFLESSFLGLFLYGEKRLGRIGHWWAAFFVFLGSWMSGYLIVATDAWMQRPVGYHLDASGKILLDSWWMLVFNNWAFWQCTHAILGEFGLKGFVEPLGFPVSSLRFKRTALAAIDDIQGADVFSLVHDTFHHRGAGEGEVFASRTGLVHISGLEDPTVSFAEMLDVHRVLIGPKDRLGNIEQLRGFIAFGN